MIRVIIAEDHHLVRQGIRALLEKLREVQVVGEAPDGQEAITLCRTLKPDIAILDISMPRLNGSQVIEKIKEENLPVRVIFLSMHSDEAIVRQVLRAGAKGYLLKSSLKEELSQAIEAAMHGEIYVSAPLQDMLYEEERLGPDRPSDPLQLLTVREQEVLKLIAEGLTNTQIAQAMQISVKTVEKHRSSLLAKLSLKDTTGLIRFAIQHKLVGFDGL